MNQREKASPEDQQFRKTFDKLFSTGTLKKSEGAGVAEPQDVALAALTRSVRGLRECLSKSLGSARNNESLRKRRALPEEPASGLFRNHLAIVDKILESLDATKIGLDAIKKNRGNYERAEEDAKKLRDLVNGSIN